MNWMDDLAQEERKHFINSVRGMMLSAAIGFVFWGAAITLALMWLR